MNLIVDIGNTFTKLYVFERNQVQYYQHFESDSQIIADELFANSKNLEYAIISSVTEISGELIFQIKKNIKELIILDNTTSLPVKILYKTPETLGRDRIAGIVGAYNIFPSKNVLAIDAGTAITFDFINSSAEYVGGNISPGLAMRFKALNYYTNKLPLLDKSERYNFIGTNTDEAIISGVQNGIIFEMNTYIERLSSEFDDFKVILTGGDTFFFAHKLKYPIFAEPFLVAIGLNRILQYNVEK